MWRIEVLRDELEEAEETLTVVLAEPRGAAIGSVNEAQVAIMETDGKREAASSCGVWCDPSSWMECFSLTFIVVFHTHLLMCLLALALHLDV